MTKIKKKHTSQHKAKNAEPNIRRQERKSKEKPNKAIKVLIIILLIPVIFFGVIKGAELVIRKITLSQVDAYVQQMASKYGFSNVIVVDYDDYGIYDYFSKEKMAYIDCYHCILYVESPEFDNTRLTDMYDLLHALEGSVIDGAEAMGYPLYCTNASLCPKYNKNECMAYKSGSGSSPHVVYGSAFADSYGDKVYFLDGGSTTVAEMGDGKTYIKPTIPAIAGSATDKDGYGHDKFDAIVIAEKVVKNNLKSPSTAAFCSSSAYTVSCVGNTWTVKGYVDAQNSFGATLRSNFTVKFTFSSNNEYTVDSCSIT